MIKVEELFIEPTATVLETLRKLDETGQRILFIVSDEKVQIGRASCRERV